MVRDSVLQVAPTALTERFACMATKLLFKASKQSLIVNAHSLEETHLELGPITTELCCQAIALALQLFLGNIAGFELIKGSLRLYYFFILVLVIFDHLINHDFVLGH